MATEVLLVKTLNRLAAYDPTSEEFLSTMKQGEVVKATISRPRNPGHHRKFFALIKLVFDSQSTYATQNLVLAWFKKSVGLGEWMDVKGQKIFIPGSISFGKMGQDEFVDFYNKAADVLITGLLPKVRGEELKARVEEIIAGSAL